jgi:tetratricopeptide (TPR) repeat protein
MHLSNLGRFQWEALGDAPAARATLERALGLDATHVPALCNAALVRLAAPVPGAAGAAEQTEAEQLLDRALELDPGHAQALAALARLLLARRKFLQAQDLLERALAAPAARAGPARARLLLSYADLHQRHTADVARALAACRYEPGTPPRAAAAAGGRVPGAEGAGFLSLAGRPARQRQDGPPLCGGEAC